MHRLLNTLHQAQTRTNVMHRALREVDAPPTGEESVPVPDAFRSGSGSVREKPASQVRTDVRRSTQEEPQEEVQEEVQEEPQTDGDRP